MELNPTSECGQRLESVLSGWIRTDPDVVQDTLKRVFLMHAFHIKNEDAFVDSLYGQRVLEEPHWDLTKEQPTALSRVRHAIGTSLSTSYVKELVVALEWSKNDAVLAEILKWAKETGSRDLTANISALSMDLAPQRAVRTFASLMSSSRPASPRYRDLGDNSCLWFDSCPNCGKIMLGFWGGRIKIYNSIDLQCEIVLPYHNSPSINCSQCTCTEIIAACGDGNLCAWDIKTGILTAKTSIQNAKTSSSARHMRWRNHKLVLATFDGNIQIWQYINSSFTLLGSWSTKGPQVSGIEFDDNYIVLQVSQDEDVDSVFYNTYTYNHIYSPAGQIKQRIESVQNTMGIAYVNGKLIAGGRDNILRIWDVGTGTCLHELEGHSHEINCIQVQPGNIVLSGDLAGTVVVWDMANLLEKSADVPETGVASTVPPSSRKLVLTKIMDNEGYVWFRFGRKFMFAREYGKFPVKLRVIDFP